MSNDLELLSQYAAHGAEDAFAEFTRLHLDLVYSAALRLVSGDTHAAEDVTQQVFTEVARQAKRLMHHPALVGWLYTTTRRMALRNHRTEQRRKAREQEAETMNETLHDDAPPPDWTQLQPVLEEAMHGLNETDRHALLLRFFQNKTLGEVGAALNLTENAARMRVGRALEKLRGELGRRGITTTAGALGSVVLANAVHAAPATLAASVASAAIAGGALQTSTFLALTHTLAMTTLQKTIVATALLAAVGVGVYSLHQGSQLRAQIKTLEQERAPLAARVQQLESDRVQGSNLVAALRDENARLKSARTEGELLKLRGEVGSLRQRALSSEAKAKQPTGLAGMMNDPAMRDYMRKAMKDKMKSMYADYIKERNLTPEQSEQFLELLSDAASAKMAQLTAAALGTQAPPDASRDITSQLGALLGADGGARLKDYSEEMPGKATLGLVNEELPNAPLTPEQGAKLVQVIKSEPSQLTQGILGSPDQAFLGSQADIDTFLQQVAESNQRILQQAGNFLDPNQLAALNTVLTKGIESRKLQGAAFFHKP